MSCKTDSNKNKKKKYEFSSIETVLTIIDLLTTIAIIWWFCDGNLPGAGFIIGGIWFIFWFISLHGLGHDNGLCDSSSNLITNEPSFREEGWLDDSDMTNDYYGRNGEFKNNDEDRALCEDMLEMKISDPDADLTDHFGWENEINYESDGYSDEL